MHEFVDAFGLCRRATEKRDLASPIETQSSSRSRAGFAIGHAMRLRFFDPTREEVVAVATDLITRFGLEAQDEALHLTEVAANIRAVRNYQLYRLAAREIEKKLRRGANPHEHGARVRSSGIEFRWRAGN